MNTSLMKSVLTVAGSDSSGGAGIQADIKTIEAHLLFAQSAITALTAQNTTGVFGIEDVSPSFVEQQIDVVFDDIRPDAVKVGMVSTPEIAHAIAAALMRNDARNIVVDPVMVATSGSTLIANDAVRALVECLFPLAAVITPNVAEAEVLSGMSIASENDMVQAAHSIAERVYQIQLEKGACEPSISCDASPDRDASCGVSSGRLAVLVKGGHGVGTPDAADDFLLDRDGAEIWLRGARIDNPNTHGTGCTLSSAIACGLALGLPVAEACRHAKEYVRGALRAGLDLGRGSGPLNHMWAYMGDDGVAAE